MKRAAFVIVAIAIAVIAVNAFAQGGTKAAPKSTTIKGELVDLGCFMGHEARGAKHKECATKCIAGGMPMGILTADGKLYVLTMSHDSPDAYNACKDLASKTVEVTGVVNERAGVRSLDVESAKPAAS